MLKKHSYIIVVDISATWIKITCCIAKLCFTEENSETGSTHGQVPDLEKRPHRDNEPIVPRQYSLYQENTAVCTAPRKVASGPPPPTYKGIVSPRINVHALISENRMFQGCFKIVLCLNISACTCF